ncbi:MAG: hypothetical protein ACC683_01695 [Acidimicrobiia bacterium]
MSQTDTEDRRPGQREELLVEGHRRELPLAAAVHLATGGITPAVRRSAAMSTCETT